MLTVREFKQKLDFSCDSNTKTVIIASSFYVLSIIMSVGTKNSLIQYYDAALLCLYLQMYLLDIIRENSVLYC